MKTHTRHDPDNESLPIYAGSLAALTVFLAVAERKSFRAAASALGVSRPAVSQAIARLERDVGTALLVRTTRSVNVTEAGARRAERAGGAVGTALGALAAAAGEEALPSWGPLRLNVPRLACRGSLPSLIAAYTSAHPGARVEVHVDDRNVDIVREGFDAGVRLREAVERDMITARISQPFRFVVVGSKAYLARRGRPRHPRDLVDHACVVWRSPTTNDVWRWEFEQRGKTLEVAVDGAVSTNDEDMLVAATGEGLGLAYVAEHAVRAELAAKELETVLEPFCPEVPGLFLYYPRAARNVPKLAAFVACAREIQRRPRSSGAP